MNTVPVPAPPPGDTPRPIVKYVIKQMELIRDLKKLVAELLEQSHARR